VEVEVEHPFDAGHAAGGHAGGEAAEEGLLVGPGGLVAVAGERRLLRQVRHPGEQRDCGVGEEVVDVGDPSRAGEFEGEERGDHVLGGDRLGGRVARRLDRARQVERGEVGDGEEHARVAGGALGGAASRRRRTRPAGSCASRPDVAGLADGAPDGWRSSLPKPSSLRISATEVWLRGVPSSARRREIS
jgi:hypothetical protein